MILDVDTGIDDAWGIYYALTAPGLDTLALTTVFGNADLDTTTRNTLLVAEWLNASVPVYRGADAPLLRPWGGPVPAFHGVNGLGDVCLPSPLRKAQAGHAADIMRTLVKAHPGEITIVAVARLTNLARALLADPSLVPLIPRVVLMGGAAFVPGNLTPVAEANIWGDPEAAQVVFQSGVPITMVGLDVTMTARLTQDDLDRWQATGPLPHVLKEATAFYIGAYQKDNPGNLGWCPVHDPLAVAVAEFPDLVGTQRYPVTIETRGQWTDGMTVVDARPNVAPSSVEVALHLDQERFQKLLKSRLLS
ncbi:nucleoside hydrolase [Sulfobacillus sp. DSM 109850]|uniref:Nucleoside hydrolase n=1 Tax=Sulfobacillus harzensis TaxID=2729629 RepID=A0A7Y0L6V1_9FIRM|nr:nucleoside hydrolase [Sulfobacillus harzensis]